jgi:hypothetical protein
VRANGDFARAVENLEEMIAEQATKLAFGSDPGNQLYPAIAGLALGAGDLGLSHEGKG